MDRATRALALTAAALLLLCTGCSDATSSDVATLRGVYALRTVDSSPLPILQWEDTYARQYLIADTLIFDGRHTVQHIIITRRDSVVHTYSKSDRQSYTSDYRLRGDTVDFLFSCPIYADCIAPPIGWLEPGFKLAYTHRKYPTGFWPPSLYERVR